MQHLECQHNHDVPEDQPEQREADVLHHPLYLRSLGNDHAFASTTEADSPVPVGTVTNSPWPSSTMRTSPVPISYTHPESVIAFCASAPATLGCVFR